MRSKRRCLDEDDELQILKKELIKQQLEDERPHHQEILEHINCIVLQQRKDAAITEYFESKNAEQKGDKGDIMIYQNL